MSDNRNRVASSRIEGNAGKSNVRGTYMLANRMIKESVILKESSRSNKKVGRGITINTRMPTTATAIQRSLFLVTIGI